MKKPKNIEALALRKIVRAWEALSGGRQSIYAVENWLREDMAPAINSARKVLGMKLPQGAR